ncbi:PfkB family carbohydrate kinase [Schaalia suimastitidis]|uniref:PfkB family carbohydrate kinase n=1 Tax=Schaalia suimastitidis TaxID=121163 RepID=UPI000428065B|nr:PfkB family carbohydrate kinase [Schaalia suimastitidis]
MDTSTHSDRSVGTGADERHTHRHFSRARAALLGLALGDALGMPTQCLSPAQIRATYGRVEGLVNAAADQPIAPSMPAGSITDDTEQALLLAMQLIRGGGHIRADEFAADLLAWEDEMRARGSLDLLGPSTKRALDELQAGAPLGSTGTTSTTNGAAMRVTPVGIACSTQSTDDFRRMVEQSCMVTHHTIHGFQSAALVAAAVSLGIDGCDVRQAIRGALEYAETLGDFGAWNPPASVLARARCAVAHASVLTETQATLTTIERWIIDEVGTSVEANEAVPAALSLAYIFADQPYEALLMAANIGGDTDTIAAIAGAILGACCGLEVFPAEDIDRLLRVNDIDIDTVARHLLALRGQYTTHGGQVVADAGWALQCSAVLPGGASLPDGETVTSPKYLPGAKAVSTEVTQARPRVLHLGQVIVDLTMRVPHLPTPGGDVFATENAISVGGGFNTLAAIRRMGVEAHYLGAIGCGPMANAARDAMTKIGVLIDGPQLPNMDTGYCVAVTEANGERSFLSTRGAETYLPDGAYDDLEVRDGDVVYLSGYSLCQADGMQALLDFFARHQCDGPKGGLRAVFDVSPMVEAIEMPIMEAVARLHPLWSLNEREAGILARRLGVDADQHLPTLSSMLSKRLEAPVLLRAGAAGAWLSSPASAFSDAIDELHVPTPTVHVVDTNGAGDAHAGVLCAALAEGIALAEALLLANCAGALAVTQFGPATCPERKDIEAAARQCEAI